MLGSDAGGDERPRILEEASLGGAARADAYAEAGLSQTQRAHNYMVEGKSLNTRVNHPNSVVNQLKKVLQAVHLSQRVISATINFEKLPPVAVDMVHVTVDGVKIEHDA